MGTRENKVETYLKNEVKRVFGGESRKWISPGHDGVTDQILFISGLSAIFVEVKTTDGELSGVQNREIKRLMDTGCTSTFYTVYGRHGVDSLIESLVKTLEISRVIGRANRNYRMHRQGQTEKVITHYV